MLHGSVAELEMKSDGGSEKNEIEASWNVYIERLTHVGLLCRSFKLTLTLKIVLLKYIYGCTSRAVHLIGLPVKSFEVGLHLWL